MLPRRRRLRHNGNSREQVEQHGYRYNNNNNNNHHHLLDICYQEENMPCCLVVIAFRRVSFLLLDNKTAPTTRTQRRGQTKRAKEEVPFLKTTSMPCPFPFHRKMPCPNFILGPTRNKACPICYRNRRSNYKPPIVPFGPLGSIFALLWLQPIPSRASKPSD